MKKRFIYTVTVILILFFTGFLYKKFYLENDNLLKIAPKTFLERRFPKVAEKPKQINTGTLKNKVSKNQIPERISTGVIDKTYVPVDRYR